MFFYLQELDVKGIPRPTWRLSCWVDIKGEGPFDAVVRRYCYDIFNLCYSIPPKRATSCAERLNALYLLAGFNK